MKTKLLSIFLSILLLTSFFTPVVAADRLEDIKLGGPEIAVFAIPEVTEIVIDGLIAVFGSACVMKIGQELGIRWDDFVKTMGIVGKTEKDTGEKTRIEDPAGKTTSIVRVTIGEVEKNWAKFVSDVTKRLNDLFHAKEWISVTSDKGEAVMKAQYECYCADVPPGGGKKDDKWYFEARLHNRKIEINTERMNEEQALKEMHRGKHIMTLNRELAENLVTRYRDATGKAPKKLKFEGDHNPDAGKFLHLHYTAHEMRLHCWIWKDI